MPHRRDPRPAMPRGRGPPLPRVLGKRERRLADEVLHLHSLWRRGPPAPAPNLPGSADRKTKTTDHKRRNLDGAAPAAAEPKDTGPPPPNSSPKTWPEAAPSSSTPAKLPPRPTSPGELAHQKALRAAAEFFSNRGASSSDGDEEGSEWEGAAGFLTGLFERDAALRGHYERCREDGQFACMACAAGKRSARRFQGSVALVQHARDASPRYGRPRAHRALAAVLYRVLGWDVARLPSIVMDPRGTLGQALAAGATAGVQLAKEENGDTGEDTDSSSDEDEEEDVETWMEDSSTDDDEEEDELESSEESAETDGNMGNWGQPDLQNDDYEDIETWMEDSSTDGDEEENELESSEESAEKEDFKKGTEDSKNTDKDEAIDPDNSEKSAEKEEIEEIGPANCQEISKNEVFCNEPVQEVNASKSDSLNQGNNGLVHKQEVAKESSEQENTNDTYLPGSKDTCKNKEHCKEAAV